MAWEQLRSTYDAIATKYEARFLDELRDKPLDRELLMAFARSVEDPVIEVGCGPGHIGAFVTMHGRRAFGVDLSRQMARLAGGRLDAALVADMRALPFATARVGGCVAFYSLIHVRRAEVGTVLLELHRLLRPGGRLLFSAHEGAGEIERDTFLDVPVPVVATLFELGELAAASEAAGFAVTRTERRAPYASESGFVRLYIEAMKPETGA